ncbi:MAG: ADP-ribosylglycohydrolase family protein [Steroidobacteraceae bacterium]
MKPPLPNSYWVEPGRFLAGEHPDGGNSDNTRARLKTLLTAGVRSFVDLTQEHELASYRELLPADIRYGNFPMLDHSVPASPQQMRAVQQALAEGMQAGMVYLHCRAGIGRTGITVGCYLRERGESQLGALTELNRLWQQNARAASWPIIPETEEQELYVREWRPQSLAEQPLQRYRGCLLTLAIGDALASAPDPAANTAAWADDTGMTLCVAESLLACGGFDGRDQLQRYRAWAQDPQGAGAAPNAALRPSVSSVVARAVWNRSAIIGSHDPAQLDPAPLARSAAAALFAGGSSQAAASLAADVARVTHQTPVLVDACRLLAAMIAQALAGSSRETVLAAAGQLGTIPLRDEVSALAAGWQNAPGGRRKPWPAALGVLDRAVRCFARSRSIGDGLARALDSPGSDRDAVCAVYGALSGAFYGEDAVESSLRRRVAELPRLARIADQLYQHGCVTHDVTA